MPKAKSAMEKMKQGTRTRDLDREGPTVVGGFIEQMRSE